MDRRTKMDDFKRGLYLAARRELEREGEDEIEYICPLLKGEIRRLGSGKGISDEELKKLFPEFFNLWDGTVWFRSSRMGGDGEHGPWWLDDEEGRLCRLDMIDFLLTRGT